MSEEQAQTKQERQHKYKQDNFTECWSFQKYNTEPPTKKELKAIIKQMKRRNQPTLGKTQKR